MKMNSQLFKIILNNIILLMDDGHELPYGYRKFIMIYEDGTIKVHDYWEKSAVPYGNYEYIINIHSGRRVNIQCLEEIPNTFASIFNYSLSCDDKKYLQLITNS